MAESPRNSPIPWKIAVNMIGALVYIGAGLALVYGVYGWP